MVNLMHYRRQADYRDGREVSISGREADDLYTPIGPLTAVGAEFVFAGDVVQQVFGDAPRWDRVGVVRYPTRHSFIDMQSRPDFQAQHVHNDAGMEQTIVMGCTPMPTPTADQPLPDWAEVPHPPTAEDGPIMVVHVLRFHDSAAGRLTPEQMQAYQNAAAEVAIPHGVRIVGWFAVEGTIVGDGRSWDQVRFNAFPSMAAAMAVASHPDRLDAQRQFREPAIADTYTLVVRPVIERITESTG